MQRIDIYPRTKLFFHSKFAPERRKVLVVLVSIRNDIQEEERRHAIGNAAYKSVGSVGFGLLIAGIIAAPITLGASLALSGASAAASVSSVAASIIHRAVKAKKIKEKISNAQSSLENHEKICFQMYKLFCMLKEDMRSRRGWDDGFLRSIAAISLRDADVDSHIAMYTKTVEGVRVVLSNVPNLIEIDAVINQLENDYLFFCRFF